MATKSTTPKVAPAAPADAAVTLPAVTAKNGFDGPSVFAADGHLDYNDPDD